MRNDTVETMIGTAVIIIAVVFVIFTYRATGQTVTEFLVFQPENTNSILAAVSQARSSSRA